MRANKNLFSLAMRNVKQHFATLQAAGVSRACDHLRFNTGVKIPGVYVFSEGIQGSENILYVGQSVSILDRLKEHCAINDHKKANFAYMLTMDESGIKPIPYSPNSTKESMFRHDGFVREFDQRIDRIRTMDFRYVPVADKLERNLLEMYAAVLLESRYNDFSD